MKILVDMNLSPDWTTFLNEQGHEAIHWSSVGSATAHDREIARWARENDTAVLTSDLDFGAILALDDVSKPSVIQIRSEVTLPSGIGRLVAEAIQRAEPDLLSGAVLTVGLGQPRIRILPLAPQREEQ